MTAATVVAIVGVSDHSFWIFFFAYMVLFILAGAGNGSTYRMIPTIFGALGREKTEREGLDVAATTVEFKRRAAAVIGIAGAIGALGGFGIQVVLRQASLSVSAAVKAAETQMRPNVPRSGSRPSLF